MHVSRSTPRANLTHVHPFRQLNRSRDRDQRLWIALQPRAYLVNLVQRQMRRFKHGVIDASVEEVHENPIVYPTQKPIPAVVGILSCNTMRWRVSEIDGLRHVRHCWSAIVTCGRVDILTSMALGGIFLGARAQHDPRASVPGARDPQMRQKVTTNPHLRRNRP